MFLFLYTRVARGPLALRHDDKAIVAEKGTGLQKGERGRRKLHIITICTCHPTVITFRNIGFARQPFKDGAQTALFKDPVRTALLTLFISVIKTNQFML
jgi:hypothetical protein